MIPRPARAAAITERWYRVRNAPWPRFVVSTNSRVTASRFARSLTAGVVDTFAWRGGALIKRHVWSPTFARWIEVPV